MKNYFKIGLMAGVVLWIVGCSTDERFTGSPVDSGLNIVTLEGTVSADITPNQTVLTGQKLNFTATLPLNKTFTDTVTVEVSSVAQSGGRTRAYVDIMPGESSASGEITAVGGSVFNTAFNLSMTAINLQTVEPGIHYLMKSNSISVKTGNSSIPTAETDRLKIRFISEKASTTNRFKLSIDKPSPSADVIGGFNNGILEHVLRTAASGNENTSQSFREGEYIFSMRQ